MNAEMNAERLGGILTGWLAKNRLSNIVGGVKNMKVGARLLALEQEHHFALAGAVPIQPKARSQVEQICLRRFAAISTALSHGSVLRLRADENVNWLRVEFLDLAERAKSAALTIS